VRARSGQRAAVHWRRGGHRFPDRWPITNDLSEKPDNRSRASSNQDYFKTMASRCSKVAALLSTRKFRSKSASGHHLATPWRGSTSRHRSLGKRITVDIKQQNDPCEIYWASLAT